MANRTRNIVLRVPVTAEERAMIERKMQQMGTGCFSVYARKMLIDGYVIRLDYSDVKAMTAELQKIGTNINQIARRVNATGTLYAQDMEDIKGAMAEIKREVFIRLQAYQQKTKLGWAQRVSDATGGKVAPDVVRLGLLEARDIGVDRWKLIGKALDKLEEEMEK